MLTDSGANGFITQVSLEEIQANRCGNPRKFELKRN